LNGQAIEQLDCSPEFAQRNFELGSYLDGTGWHAAQSSATQFELASYREAQTVALDVVRVRFDNGSNP
jgi:hypothetical protein